MQFGDLLLVGIDMPELSTLLENGGYTPLGLSQIEDWGDRNRPCDLVILSEESAERIFCGDYTPEYCTRIAPTAVFLDEPYTVRHSELRTLLRNGTFTPFYRHEVSSGLILKRIEHLILFGRITGNNRTTSMGENERIRLEEEIRLREMVLRNEQETNANIFASISSGLMLIDRDGTILRLNRAAHQLLGVEDGSLGTRFDMVLPPVITHRCRRALAAADTLSETFEDASLGETRLRVSMFPIRDYRSAFIGILVHLRDITEHVNVKTQLYRTERLATVGTMLSGVAHELRNPLSIISAGAQRGRTRENPTKEWNDRNYQSIETQVSRCSALVDGLLNFARGERFQAEEHAAEKLIEEAVGYVSYQNLFDDIRLEQSIPSGCRLFVDRTRFVQALVNLLLNAAQAMDGNGSLEITAKTDKHSMIRIQVQDTGPGIPKDVGDRIFDPFYTTKAPGKGTGLGLSIVHKIVRESGGTIHYLSEPGKTCFSLLMPSKRAKPANSSCRTRNHHNQ